MKFPAPLIWPLRLGLLAAAVAALAWCWSEWNSAAFRFDDLRRTGTPTHGRVMDRRERWLGQSHIIDYDYQAGERTVRITGRPTRLRATPGSSIRVWYDPADVSCCVSDVESGGIPWGAGIAAVVGVMLLGWSFRVRQVGV
jgi:hypothetical protein